MVLGSNDGSNYRNAKKGRSEEDEALEKSNVALSNALSRPRAVVVLSPDAHIAVIAVVNIVIFPDLADIAIS